jgi:3-methyladenine DNA glycosylase AlkD
MRRGSKGTSPTLLFFVVERLLRHERLEPRWLAFHLLDETMSREPERSWQLLRRAARDARDWITIDSLAHPVAHGILAEPFRWAEIEQLAFSASSWERRLVGSTIATMPFTDHVGGRSAAWTSRALGVLGELIGDAEPEVQKALSWAYRSVAMVDPEATASALAREADEARDLRDGHRAWVIRDALPKLPPDRQADLKARLSGIRREAGAPSTSGAAAAARMFAEGGLGPLPDDATLPSRHRTN